MRDKKDLGIGYTRLHVYMIQDQALHVLESIKPTHLVGMRVGCCIFPIEKIILKMEIELFYHYNVGFSYVICHQIVFFEVCADSRENHHLNSTFPVVKRSTRPILEGL